MEGRRRARRDTLPSGGAALTARKSGRSSVQEFLRVIFVDEQSSNLRNASPSPVDYPPPPDIGRENPSERPNLAFCVISPGLGVFPRCTHGVSFRSAGREPHMEIPA